MQSPAVDVVGIGLESGGVVLHNLRYDETVMRFHQEWGPITGLSFRTGRAFVYTYCKCMCIHVIVLVGFARPLMVVYEAMDSCDKCE